MEVVGVAVWAFAFIQRQRRRWRRHRHRHWFESFAILSVALVVVFLRVSVFFFLFFHAECVSLCVFMCFCAGVCKKYFTRCFGWASKALDCWVAVAVVAARSLPALGGLLEYCWLPAVGVRCRWLCYHFSCWLTGCMACRLHAQLRDSTDYWVCVCLARVWGGDRGNDNVGDCNRFQFIFI